MESYFLTFGNECQFITKTSLNNALNLQKIEIQCNMSGKGKIDGLHCNCL